MFSKRTSPRGGHGQGDGERRRLHLRLDAQKLAQALCGAGGLRDLRPDLGHLAERARREHGVKHELAERAGAHPPREHIGRAPPQDRHHACEDEENDDRGQHRACRGGVARAVIGALDGGVEAFVQARLGGEGLDGAHGADGLARERGGIGQTCPAPRASGVAPSGRRRRAAGR